MSHKYPSSHVFYRKLTREYPRIVRGDGCYLYDDRGRRYLDGSGGAYVVNVGHGVSEIAEALACQAGRVAYVSGTAFTLVTPLLSTQVRATAVTPRAARSAAA